MYFTIVWCLCSYALSTSIYNDSIPLQVLDDRIIKGMTDPQKDIGENLLMNAYNYYNILDDIEILLKEKNQQGVERLETLIASGGPKFVNVTMAEDDMRYIYKWDPSEFNELRATIVGTKVVWKRLLQRLRRIKLERSGAGNITSEESNEFIVGDEYVNNRPI